MVAPSIYSPPPLTGYSLTEHIGVVPWDYSDEALDYNQLRLTQALEAMWSGGSFGFHKIRRGPLIWPIVCPGETFYFRCPIETNSRIGGSMFGTGGTGYIMIDDFFLPNPNTTGGMKTRFVGVNSSGEQEPVIRLNGNGFKLYGIDFYGQRYVDNGIGVGEKAIACIQCGGANIPNQGRVTITECGFHQATYGVHLLPGYISYDQQVGAAVPWSTTARLVTEESHADHFYLDQNESFNCESTIRSENQIGGFGFLVNRLTVESVSGPETVVFDWDRGGCLNANVVTINHPQATVLQLHDFSINNAWFDINGIYWDRSGSPDQSHYLTLVKQVIPTVVNGQDYYGPFDWFDWRIRMSGGLGDPDKTRYDYTRLMDVDSTLDTSDFLFDIKNLPLDNFDLVGSGPFVTPAIGS